MKRSHLISLLAVAACGGTAVAQTGGTLLRGEEVTVDALVRALTPEDRTRSIGVRPSAASRVGVPAAPDHPGSAAERPSASLLITFETNSAELTAAARRTLDTVGKALGSDELSEFSFVVEGHADPRGHPDANLRLSRARAESVQRYLQQAYGISGQRLSAVGKGDREPMNTRNPIAPENRRVTIVNASG